MELTTAQRVRRLRAKRAADNWQKSPIRRGYVAAQEVNAVMAKHFPGGWQNFKVLLAVGGLLAMTQVLGHICVALTGTPLD